MAEIPDVVAQETILTNWGNPIRDRTVQRYADTSERDSLNPVPTNGDIAYLEDLKFLQLHNGAVWVKYLPANGDGYMTGDLRIESGTSKKVSILRTGGQDTVELYLSIDGTEPQSGQIVWSRAGAIQSKITLADELTTFADRIAAPGANFTNIVYVTSTLQMGEESSTTERQIQLKRTSSGVIGSHTISVTNRAATQAALRIRTDQAGSSTDFYFGDHGLELGAANLASGVARNVWTGTSAPAPALGAVGDVYIQVT